MGIDSKGEGFNHSMNRRQFISSSSVAALALGHEPKAMAAAAVPETKPVLMKLGCQSAPTTDAHLKYLARYGVRNICGYPETAEGPHLCDRGRIKPDEGSGGEERHRD